MADHLGCPGEDWCPIHDIWHPGDEPCPECHEAGWGGDLEDAYAWGPDDVIGLGPCEPTERELAEWEAEQAARAAEEAAWERGGWVPLAWLNHPGVN